MTQRINPTKQGYRLILVPATGVKWSTVWSTVLPQTSATHPLGIPYMSLTQYWGYKFVNCLYAAVIGCVYSLYLSIVCWQGA